ncbi:MAG: hypothetical protein M0R73_02665 [Dehalococcoidia bacterium]|nr:hypothetical protein [Dehalococcoidia bacterium]
MASKLDLTSPTDYVKVGVMAIVAFMLFRFIAQVTNSQALASRIPS